VDKSKKCNLWDPIEQRHAEEVSEAAKRALAELRKSRPDVDQSNIKVDLPVAHAAAPPVPPPPQLRPIAALPNRQAGLGLNGLAGLPPAYAAAGPARAVEMAQWGGAAPGGFLGGGGGAHMDHGGGAVANFHPAYAGLNMGMGMGAGAGPLAGAGIHAVAGGMAMGAPLPGGAVAARNDPFVFGAGQGHNFIPPPAMGPLYRQWFDIRRQAGAGEVHAAPIPVPVPVPVPVPGPAEPLALARGRRFPARMPQMQPQPLLQPQIRPQVQMPMQAQVRAQAQPQVSIMAAAGGGQRHRGQ